MKKEVYRSNTRGGGDYGWLSTRHSFSFGDYFAPARTGFGALRVFNDDTVAAGKGFPEHPHSDMEIISIVTEGVLAHKDSTGSESALKAGEVQAMTAGSGVMHSEYNHSRTKPVKFFQIWIQPKKPGLPPNYSQKNFPESAQHNAFVALASGNNGSQELFINQDAIASIGSFEAGKKTNISLEKGRGLFVFVVEGKVKCGGDVLLKRDSVSISEASKITLEFLEKSRVIVIEVPMD